ncbi:RNA-binding protein 26 [Acropora cervicornis]|uniref:RNA-binding protein 26 n=1 Tax=Acropora cervicornis TaxID=6130 RepID=A0AAD9Q0N3_ACRCE|nr:RNA-binding protein 26 [Acropora cervicornis]
MQIQSVEALKSWLTTRLESVCDADPAALAKYVVALVKKDKPMEELKDICVDQLEVFLSDETANFVNVLFDALTNSSYMPQVMVEPTVAPIAVPAPQVVMPITPAPSPVKAQERPRKTSVTEDVLTARVQEEPDDDERDFKRIRRGGESSDHSTDIANSVVPGSGERPRKRRADEERSKGDFSKIPKEEQGGARRVDSDDSRNVNVYPIPSSVHRERGIKHGPEGGDAVLRPGMHPHDDRRGRRGSPLRDHRGGRMGRERMVRDRYRDDRMRHDRRDDRERTGARKSRCRDYDEKGFCMRGELCPFDHGNDPVVVQEMLPPGMLGFPASTGPPFLPDGQPMSGPALQGNPGPLPGGYPTTNSQPPPPGTANALSNDGPKSQVPQKGADSNVPASGPHSAAPSGMVPPGNQAPVMPPHAVRMMQPRSVLRGQAPRPPFGNPYEDSYNPEQPQFDRTPVWMRLGNGRPPHILPPQAGVFPPPVRLRSRGALLPVTPSPAQLTVQVPTQPDRIVIHSDLNKNAPAVPQDQPPQQPQIPGIPQQNATKVCAFNDPEAALVQFSHHSEAKAAHSCPDAVLGNRFIRVFWHNPDRPQNNKDGNANRTVTSGTANSGTATVESGTKEETASKTNVETKAKPTMFQSGKTTFSKTPKPAAVHVSAATPVMTKRQLELQKQEAIKKKLEIQKQKQELLNKQIKEQKLLISKLEKKNLGSAEKDLIVKTIKSLSSNIEALKKEVELAAMAAKSKESPSQARQIAKSLGLLDPQPKGRGRGIGRGRGRGITLRTRPFPRTTRVWTRDSASLDHRTTQITVADITPEQREDLAEHFREFGIVDNEDYDEDTRIMILTYRTRKEAEIAYNKGKTFKGRALKISWYRAALTPVSPSAAVTTPTTPTVLKKVEEQLAIDFESELGKHEFDLDVDEALLLREDFDEEEEEEDERPWKR